jgi:hypothetical protein
MYNTIGSDGVIIQNDGSPIVMAPPGADGLGHWFAEQYCISGMVHAASPTGARLTDYRYANWGDFSLPIGGIIEESRLDVTVW